MRTIIGQLNVYEFKYKIKFQRRQKKISLTNRRLMDNLNRPISPVHEEDES